ncbi:MAG: hypothetical protein NWE95_12195 [Candidatus Bathyarchaeota archaeon]|nr:hypothetical protein [Candidatus Bathyarchaeota archaeon]
MSQKNNANQKTHQHMTAQLAVSVSPSKKRKEQAQPTLYINRI